MNNKPPLFVGNSPSPQSPSLCFPSPKTGGGGSSGGGSSGSSSQQKQDNSGLCGCHRAPRSHCISAIGVLVLVIAYTAMGSILFVSLEGEDDETSGNGNSGNGGTNGIGSSGTMETAVAASKPYPRTDLVNADIRSRTVDRLWSITEDLNILYKENWTRLAAQEVQNFQETLLRAVRASKSQQIAIQPSIAKHKWTYASAFLYSLTLITTIGYGGISPRTQWGRIAALIYALFGIPIVLLYLSAMGEGLSSAMRCIFRRVRPANSKASSLDGNDKRSHSFLDHGMIGDMRRPHHPHLHHHHHHSASVPISVCVMILITYVTLGAVLFHKIQPWGVLESLYFCFTSLGTIGFGDLAPKGQVTQYAAAGYILVGMAVVAMCFSLIQTELIIWLRRFGVQDGPGSGLGSPTIEDVALVTVSMTTPKLS